MIEPIIDIVNIVMIIIGIIAIAVIYIDLFRNKGEDNEDHK